jgi:choline dehydrogenase-like flavoprotein
VIKRIASDGPRRVRSDVCIVGSGAAGLTLARELDGTSLRVVVLEGGGRNVEERSQRLYSSEIAGLEHRGVHELRFRAFGGSTTRWAGQALPLNDMDFEQRDWVPDSGWPIGRGELEPYYARATEIMDMPPFPRDPEADWPGVLPSPPAFDRELLTPFFTQFAAEPNFAMTLGESLSASSNVEILLGANVTELVLEAGLGAVGLASVSALDGAELEVEADVFVLCCGGIETARILLASDTRVDGGIGNSHDLVGRFFQDHPGFAAGPIAASGGGELRSVFAPRRSAGVKFLTKFGASETLQRRERLLGSSGAVLFEGSQSPAIDAGKTLVRALREPELRGETRSALRAIARDPMPLVRAGARYVRGQPALDTSGEPTLGVGCEQRPNRESRIRLAEDRDELGMRRTVIDWRLTEEDIRACRRIAEVAAAEFERLGLGSVDLAGFELPDDPDDLSGLVVDAGHHMGTTRMADDATRGVVDRDCKVFGLDNLYIGSSSTFPTGGSSNPTLTLIALCLRLADTLKERVLPRVAAAG